MEAKIIGKEVEVILANGRVAGNNVWGIVGSIN